MAVTLGAMCAGFAGILRVPQPEVERFARVLRDARLLTTDARGVNAPKMTCRDAARMLLALLATNHAPMAAHAVQDYGDLVNHMTQPNSDRPGRVDFVLGGEGERFPERHRLEDALVEVIRIFTEDSDKEYFKKAQTEHRDDVYLPPFRMKSKKAM